MSCKQRREIFFIFYFYMLQRCHSVSLGQREDGLPDHQVQESTGWERIKPGPDAQQAAWHLVPQVVQGPDQDPDPYTPTQPGLTELRLQSAAFPGEPLPHTGVPKPDENDINSLSWTTGNISRQPRSPASHSEHADFAGFDGLQGKVLGQSVHSNPHFSEWLAMSPLVHCGDKVMTFTASGEGFTHLFVDREGASPISLLQLPPYCGYSMRTSWSDLEMMVPYDACYITQENGSYVLALLWWDTPLKLSCPAEMSTPAPPSFHSTPSVFCSPYIMAVQIHGQEQDIAMMGVMVNGGWRPFVSEECAYRGHAHPEDLIFFISYNALCITGEDGLHLQLVLDDQEYILSCPGNPEFPYIPSPPLAPGDPQFPYIPAPVSPAPTSTPPPLLQPPTREQIAQLPHYPYPGFQYPQVYPPGPEPDYSPQPTTGSPPGQQQQSLHHTRPGKLPYSPGVHPKYPSLPYWPAVVVQASSSPNLSPVQESSPHQVSKLPVGPSQYPSGVNYPYVPFHYPAVTPAPTPAARTTATVPPVTEPPKPPAATNYPQDYLQIPYYLAPTAALVTQAPAALPPSPPSPLSPPKQPVGPQYPFNLLYPQTSYNSYSHYAHFFHPNLGLEVQTTSTSHPTITPPSPLSRPIISTTTRMMVPKQPDIPSYPFSQFYPQSPIYFPLPTSLPPTKEKPQTLPQVPQKPAVPQATCGPYAHTICGYYPYPYYPYYQLLYPPHYHPPSPPVPQYPETLPPIATKMPFTITTTTSPTTTSSTAFFPTWPNPQNPHFQCLMGRMIAFLPFAHPDSVQVRDQMKTWLFLSGVSPLCGYILQMAEDFGVILHSPLPACHSQLRTPTTISLPLRFWDLSMEQYRTLDLQCPYPMAPETPAPVSPSVFPTPSSTSKIIPPTQSSTSKIIPPTQSSTSKIIPPTPSSTSKIMPPIVPKPEVFCSAHQMTVVLPSGPISGIVVKDIKGNQMNLQDPPKHCGYSVREDQDGKIRLILQLHSDCHKSVQGIMYIITVVYMTVNGEQETQFSCPVVIPASGQECNLPSKQRLPCRPGSVSQAQCLSMGCCFSKQPPACYYPMDECTIDRHFVFFVPASLTEPPLSPALLITAGNSTCKPERVTSDYALFKIPMDGCGTRRVMVGKTIIYMVEVINQVQAISLNYGTITRDSPVRLLVECRYLPNTVVSVSYMVKTPTLGPAIQTQGQFGVQLRIAKDAQYSSYHPQYHQPLQMLLGKPLYLEVRLLNTPDPSLMLLVHFCVAYPRSGKAVWLLLYNGCPNPLDSAQQQAVLFDPQPLSPQAQTRRFTISTFQFLPDGEFKDPDEEIYFMCSTEICSPRDGPCVEGCFVTA